MRVGPPRLGKSSLIEERLIRKFLMKECLPAFPGTALQAASLQAGEWALESVDAPVACSPGSVWFSSDSPVLLLCF